MATKQDKAQDVSKITAATVTGMAGGLSEEVLASLLKHRSLVVYDVFGVITGTKIIPPKGDKFSEAVRFIGTFKAINRLRGAPNPLGASFTSTRAYFPGFIEERLHAAMNGEGSRSLEVAIRISIKFDAKAATKYVYTAEPLIESREADALRALEERIGEQLKALPAPGDK